MATLDRITTEEKCRVCRGKLVVALDLGEIYPSAFLKKDELPGEKAPLVVAECEDCGLVQLKHTIDLDLMYRQYWYASSLNKSMVSSLNDIVREIESRTELIKGDTVVDIGCNDGTMLNMFDSKLTKIGFDPSRNLQRSNNFEFVNDYFSAEKYHFWKAKVITAIAMFYDLPDPHRFVEDVATVLRKDGIFVVQFTDLLSMIKATAFDNICHEHLEYYTLRDVNTLLETHGLQIIDVSYNDVNGGSLRVTAAHAGIYPAAERVGEFLAEEALYLKKHNLSYFKENILRTKFKVREVINWAHWHKQTVYLLGASTKGNTLLQVCELTGKDIPYAAEVNKDKFGLRTAGSDIEIISEIDALIKHPHYFLVPVWHFKESILSNPKIKDYLLSGGRLIFPLPYFHIIYLDYAKNIQEVRI